MASADLSRINTNIAALNALNALNRINTKMSVHQLRLATGKRINTAADDAAGFTIATKLHVKAEGLGVALDNIGSSKNLMTVAEGHLTNIQDILAQMKAKAQQAANDTLGTAERAAILAELQEFNNQINAEVTQAQWAGVDILGTDKTFQIGVGSSTSDSLTFNVAESVWGSGTATTFNSAGLDVQASSSTVDTVAITATSASGMAFDTPATPVATGGTIHSLLSELNSGHYILEVSSTAASSVATVSITLRDSDGELVSIDADGNAAAGSVGTTLTVTTSGAGNPAALDLGVGVTVNLTGISTSASGTGYVHFDYTKGGNSVDSQANAQTFMGQIDSAIDLVSDGLSYIGSTINRLTFQEESLSVAKVNTQAAYSRIMDADMAWEQLEATKLMILQQTATAMLAQANVAPQTVLALFGG